MPSEGWLFEQALLRPDGYAKLSGGEQWGIDKRLGILDWRGGCEHMEDDLCRECEDRWYERWKSGGKLGGSYPRLHRYGELAELREKVQMYEGLLHDVQMFADVVLDGEKVSRLVRNICSWSYSHRRGNGELSEDEQERMIRHAFDRLRDVPGRVLSNPKKEKS
jgi:hypothetical protein